MTCQGASGLCSPCTSTIIEMLVGVVCELRWDIWLAGLIGNAARISPHRLKLDDRARQGMGTGTDARTRIGLSSPSAPRAPASRAC